MGRNCILLRPDMPLQPYRLVNSSTCNSLRNYGLTARFRDVSRREVRIQKSEIGRRTLTPALSQRTGRGGRRRTGRGDKREKVAPYARVWSETIIPSSMEIMRRARVAKDWS